MLYAMHSNIPLYGYESYTGQFIKWYAEYYHNILIRNAIIWVAEPMTEDLKVSLEEKCYIREKIYLYF